MKLSLLGAAGAGAAGAAGAAGTAGAAATDSSGGDCDTNLWDDVTPSLSNDKGVGSEYSKGDGGISSGGW